MKNHLSHLFIALAVCASSLVGYGIWYVAIATTSTNVADLQNRINARIESANRIATARSAIAEIAGDEVVVRNYFVPEAGAVAFIDELEARGRAEGSVVNVLSVTTGTKGTRPVLELSLTVKGAFDAVMRTVGAIEYAPYDISISGLSLVENAKNSWQANLKFLVGSVSASTATSTP